MHFRSIAALHLAPLSLAAAACAPAEPPAPVPPAPNGPSPATCDATRAQGLVGQKATADSGAQAQRLTGARSLRWGPPGAVFTMDYREDRVNVLYDGAMTITEIRCG